MRNIGANMVHTGVQRAMICTCVVLVLKIRCAIWAEIWWGVWTNVGLSACKVWGWLLCRIGRSVIVHTWVWQGTGRYFCCYITMVYATTTLRVNGSKELTHFDCYHKREDCQSGFLRLISENRQEKYKRGLQLICNPTLSWHLMSPDYLRYRGGIWRHIASVPRDLEVWV